MRIAYVLYPEFTAMDVVGPYEVISRWPGAEVCFVATSMQPVVADFGLTVLPADTLSSVSQPDVIVVPGAPLDATLDAVKDPDLIGWIHRAAPGASWLASACTGSLLYAAAGLLENRRANTHWAARAGVSAGIEMALLLTARVHGEELAKALQLNIEYDPQPPFASGSPGAASPSTLRLAFRMLLGDAPLRTTRKGAAHLVTSRLRRVPHSRSGAPD